MAESTPSVSAEPRPPSTRAHRWPFGWATLLGLSAAALGSTSSFVLGVPIVDACVGGLSTAVAAAVLFVVFSNRRASDRLPRAGVGEELGDAASVAEVVAALERAVRQLVGSQPVRVLLEPVAPIAPGTAPMRLPLSCRGESVGVIEVGGTSHGPVLGAEELARLGALVRPGAVVLSYAIACERIEQERRHQAAAWRGEREALVETVAAEIAHEVRYSINYFRSLFETANGKVTLTAEQADIGREEVERLERLVSGLRRRTAHRIERRNVGVSDLCGRAEAVLRDRLAGRRIAREGAPETIVRCDVDQTTQILVNLLANALEATDPQGRVGVRWAVTVAGLELTVWDDGPGFVGDPAALFAPWYTTKERGTGLGLAITHRLARAHGWEVQATRAEGITCFTITISPSDLVGNGEPRKDKRAVA